MRLMMLALILLPLAVGCMSLPRVAGAGHELVAVASAFNAAWNAHDLPAVLALLADEPAVLVAAPIISGYGDAWQVDEAYGLSAPVDYPAADSGQDPLIVAAGRAQVRAWVQTRLAANHRVQASNSRVAGERVTWDYTATADPYQQLQGVPPTEGTVEVLLRGNRIAALTIRADPESVRRRELAVVTAAATSAAAQAAAGRSLPAGEPIAPPSAAAVRPPLRLGALHWADPLWALTLTGLGLTSYLLFVRRRPW